MGYEGLEQSIEVSWFDANGIDIDSVIYPEPEKKIVSLGSDPAPEGFTKVSLPVPEILREEIEAQWKEFAFTNNILPNIRKTNFENGKLYLEPWITDYKSISMMAEIFSVLKNPQSRQYLKYDWSRIEPRQIDEMIDIATENINGIAVGGATLTKGREEIVLGKKAVSKRVYHGGLYITLPAGYVVYDKKSGRSNPKDALYWQTQKELGLAQEDFERPRVFTVVKGLTHVYNSIMGAELFTKLTPSEMQEIFKTKAGDKYETDSLLQIKVDRTEMMKGLRQYCNRMIDNGLGIYLQFGRREHGQNWYNEALDMLRIEFGVNVRDK